MKAYNAKYRRAFTLIELMVVVLVIMILSGILFRLSKLVQDRTRVARTVYELQQIQNALNEFYAEYGHYPPIDFVPYEYENASNQWPNYMQDAFIPAYGSPPSANAVASGGADPHWFPDRGPGQRKWVEDDWPYNLPGNKFANEGLGYRYGLVSYLINRRRGNQVAWFDDDTDEDRAVKARWFHYIDGIVPNRSSLGGGGSLSMPGYPAMEWTNTIVTVRDPWGSGYQYVSRPPYTRYRLWSVNHDLRGEEGE